jgi:hypothetical protein
MKVMPAIPGQETLPISYARPLERPSEAFCRMLSAEIASGQDSLQDLQKIVSAQIRKTDIFEQLEASLNREHSIVPVSAKAAPATSANGADPTKNDAVDVARVLDFMNDAARVGSAKKAQDDGTVKLGGDKTAVVAGIRQSGASAWDKYHMASSSKKDVGVFVGFRISIG